MHPSLRCLAALLVALVTSPVRAQDATTRRAEKERGLRLLLEDHDTTGSALALSADGKTLMAPTLASEGNAVVIRLRSLESGKTTALVGKHRAALRGLALTRDGRRLVAGGGAWQPAKTPPKMFGGGATFEPILDLKVWDVRSGALIAELEGHKNVVTGLCLSPDEILCATIDYGGTAKIWDTKHWKERASLAAHKGALGASIAFSPNARRLATASDTSIKLWDGASFEERSSWTVGAVASAIAFSPDSKTLAAIETTYAKDPTGETPRVERSEVVLRDVASGEVTRRLPGPEGSRLTCLAFSPDRKWLAAGGEKGVRIWDAVSGKELAALHGHLPRDHGIGAVVFAADSRALAASGDDRVVRIWDLEAVGMAPAK